MQASTLRRPTSCISMSSLAEPLLPVGEALQPNNSLANANLRVAPPSSELSLSASSGPLATRSQRRLLYLSYAFASFGDRAWEFASLVFIVELFPSTLLYASVFGVIETAAGLLSGPYIGAWMDRNQRLPVIRISVIGQNAVMAVASLVFFIALTASRSDRALLYLAYSALTICACFIKISSALNKISLHKDWTPCVAAEDRTVLSEMNAAMRRVDLTNSIVAPLVVGVLSSMTSPATAIASLGIWSAMSLVTEIQLCAYVWRAIPALQHKDVGVVPREGGSDSDTSSVSRSFRTYSKSPVFQASLSYCMLYISVLNFGGIMTSFLASDAVQLSDALLAVGRAAGAAVGIAATVVTPYFIKHYGLVHSGNIALLSQLFCLCATQAAFLLLSSLSRSVFIVLLFCSLSASRFGLWIRSRRNRTDADRQLSL